VSVSPCDLLPKLLDKCRLNWILTDLQFTVTKETQDLHTDVLQEDIKLKSRCHWVKMPKDLKFVTCIHLAVWYLDVILKRCTYSAEEQSKELVSFHYRFYFPMICN